MANSRGWRNQSTAAGTIERVDGAGNRTTFSADNLLRGPNHVRWVTSTTSPFSGELIVNTEDLDEAGAAPWDAVVGISADGTTARQIAPMSEGLALDFGPGGAWGEDLYVAGREPVGRGDGPNRLWRIDGSGNRTEFTSRPAAQKCAGFGRLSSTGARCPRSCMSERTQTLGTPELIPGSTESQVRGRLPCSIEIHGS